MPTTFPGTTPAPGVTIESARILAHEQAINDTENAKPFWGGYTSVTNRVNLFVFPDPYPFTNGQTFRFYAANANTGPVTAYINGWYAGPLVSPAGTALVGGEIAAGSVVEFTYYTGNCYMISALPVPGPVKYSHRAMAASGNILSSDVVVYATATGITLTLPDPAANDQLAIRIKNTNNTGPNVTIATVAGLIDGAATFSLGPMSAITVHSDGVGWWIL